MYSRRIPDSDSDHESEKAANPTSISKGVSSSREQISSALIDSLLNSSTHLTPQERSEIESLRGTTEVKKFIDIVGNLAVRGQTPVSFPRICSQLRGHVQFLMRLAATPELQSLFLISDRDGTTFLSETAKHLILEQAGRTTQFLADLPNSDRDDIIPSIETQLGLKLDPEIRLDKIREFVRDEISDSRELSEMLWQEIVISDTLRRFYLGSNHKVSDDLKQSYETKLAELEEQYKSQSNSQIHKLRKQIRREIAPEIREQVKNELEGEIRENLTYEIRAQVARELRPQLREEVTIELTPKLSRSIREKVRQELIPEIRKELTPKLRDEAKRELHPVIERELSAKFEAEKVELTSRIEKRLRRDLTPAIREEVAADLEPKIREQLRPQIADEITQRVTATIRSELTDDFQKKLECEVTDQTGRIRAELTPKIAREQRKIAEAELRPLLVEELTENIRTQLTQELVPPLTQKIRRELKPKLAKKIRAQLRETISRELHSKVKEELRSEMQETIRENVRLELTPILTAQIREALELDRDSLDFLVELFETVSEALGDGPQPYSVEAFIAQTNRLAKGVTELRRHFKVDFEALIQLLLDLEAERAHLDQLHTQTRSLLVRQAQIISELREAATKSRKGLESTST